MSENITVSRSELDQIKAELALLRKASSKSKIARHTPKDNIGLSIKVSTYTEEYADETKVITSWKLIKNFVRATEDRGLVEDQVMRIYFTQDLEKGKKLAYTGQRKKLANKLEALDADSETYAKDKQKIEEDIKVVEAKLSGEDYKDLPYKNFLTDIEKKEVQVKATTVREGKTYYEFDYNEKEYSIDAHFIN